MPRRVTGSNAFRGAPCQLCAGTANGFHTCLSHPLGRSRPTQPAGGGGTPARSEAGAGRGVSGITHPTSPGGSLRAEHSSSPLRVAGFPPAAAGAEGRRRPAAPRPSASRPSASRPCGGAPLSAPRRRRSGGGPRPLSAGSAAAAWRDRGEARGQRVPRLCGRGRPAFRQSGAGRSLRLSARRGRGGSCHVLCAERRGKPARASVPRVAERGSCRRPARTLPLSRRCPSLPRPSVSCTANHLKEKEFFNPLFQKALDFFVLFNSLRSPISANKRPEEEDEAAKRKTQKRDLQR